MNMSKYSGGAVLAILGAAAVVIVAALRWLGANKAAIGAGVSVLFEVCMTVTVLAGIAAGVLTVASRRRRAAQAAEQAPPPVQHMTSEQIPLPRDDTPALPPGNELHLHFTGLSPDEVAEAIRQARERR